MEIAKAQQCCKGRKFFERTVLRKGKSGFAVDIKHHILGQKICLRFGDQTLFLPFN